MNEHHESIRDYLTARGYDGVWDSFNGSVPGQVVAYTENQVKRTDNKNPTENVDTRFSRETDAAYLAAVKAGDMDTAQRMVDDAAKRAGYRVEYMYRGGHSNHNILLPANQREDAEYAEPGNLGCGIYFTPDRAYAERFGKVQKFYLKYSKAADITNDEAVKKVLRDIENGFYWDADEGSPDYELYDTGGRIC
jgi:hypothetical protein